MLFRSDLDKVTQQNASLVEESTAASESLQELAREMVDAVSVFKLNGRAVAQPEPRERKVSQRPLALVVAPAGGADWKQF